MVDNAQEQVRIEDVITVERPAKPFTPEAPVMDVPTPLLTNDVMKRDFILAVNALRLGIARLEVAVSYEIQVGEPEDLRRPDVDFVSIPGVSPKVHIGPMTTATNNREGGFYIRLADKLRSTGLKTGWTSMRATGITSFKILTMSQGPIFEQNNVPNATPQMAQLFQMVWTALQGATARA